MAPLPQDDRQQDRRSQQRLVSPHAGAINAAPYLQEFVDPRIPWAHLDVMAWNPQSRPGRPEGAEATALRALYAHIAQRFG